MLKIKVNGQYASKYNDKQMVSDAVNFISIQFEFDSSWEELDKTYQFSNDNIDIDVVSNENVIQIPHEVLIPGKLSVKVRGVKLSVDGVSLETKATSNPIYYNILDSELVVADNSTPIEPEIKEQIRQLAERANILATTTYDRVVEVEDEIYIIVQIKNNMIELKSQVMEMADSVNLIRDDIEGLQEDINTSISNFTTEEVARVAAEDLRNTAEIKRNSTFNEIVQNSEEATYNANEAADKANLARENIQSQYDNLAGVGRTNETVKSNTDKLNSKIKQAIFTATVNNTMNIVHNLVAYNPAKDDLLVFYKGILLDLAVHYQNNANNISVDLLDWSINTGEKISFKLYKDVK